MSGSFLAPLQQDSTTFGHWLTEPVATVIAAGIGAVALIIAAILGLRARQAGRRAEEWMNAASDAELKLANCEKSRTAEREALQFGAAEVEEVVEFEESGRATVTRSYRGLYAHFREKGARLPMEFTSSIPHSRVEELEPDGTDPKLFVEFRVDKRETGDQGAVVACCFVFQKGLLAADRANLGVRLRVSQMFVTTRTQAKQLYQREDEPEFYQFRPANITTGKLVLEVRFPPSHHSMKPHPAPVAYLVDRMVELPTISASLSKTFGFDGKAARLEVESPEPSIGYAIRWIVTRP